MTKALVTFAVGRHTELLELSRPGFQAYAARHGYTYMETWNVGATREPSWWKVRALIGALAFYDEVLWIDCDVAIVDGSRDLAADVPPDAWQALVMHHTQDGEVPNCGVWYVRRTMTTILEAVWSMDRYLDHVWWEQAAMLELLGYNPTERPVRRHFPSELYDRTHWLPLEWNSHEQNDRHPSPRFAHCTPNGVDWRKNIMRGYLTQAPAEVAG